MITYTLYGINSLLQAESNKANNRLISLSNDVNAVIQEIDLNTMIVSTIVQTQRDSLIVYASTELILSEAEGLTMTDKVLTTNNLIVSVAIILTRH